VGRARRRARRRAAAGARFQSDRRSGVASAEPSSRFRETVVASGHFVGVRFVAATDVLEQMVMVPSVASSTW
jgi:hypothetical protein